MKNLIDKESIQRVIAAGEVALALVQAGHLDEAKEKAEKTLRFLEEFVYENELVPEQFNKELARAIHRLREIV